MAREKECYRDNLEHNLELMQERVKALRLEKGYKQEELAMMADLSPKVVRFYERGAFVPSVSTVIKLANTLCVTTDYLLGLSDRKD